jgi:hypothetical protein
LMITVANPAENIGVRATALRAATQLQWDGQTNVPLILSEAVKLEAFVAKAYNDELAAKKPVSSELRHANFQLYLAFRPATAHQGSTLNWGLLNQIRRPGLSQHEPAITAAYNTVLPVINHIVGNPKPKAPIPAAPLAAIDAWIQANPPVDRKPTPVSPRALP